MGVAVSERVRALLKRFTEVQARPITDAALVARMRSEATTWINAVHMQRRRASHPLVNPDAVGDEFWRQEIDLHFLVVALFRLRRAIALAATVDDLEAELNARLASFDEQVPWLKQVRHVAEHFDDYTTDKGRDPSIRRSQLQVWSLGEDEQNGLVWRWLDLDVSVEATHDAATDLYRRFLEEAEGFLAR